jgi:hypothetical protein
MLYADNLEICVGMCRNFVYLVFGIERYRLYYIIFLSYLIRIPISDLGIEDIYLD